MRGTDTRDSRTDAQVEASSVHAADAAAAHGQCLTFRIGRTALALDILRVDELIRYIAPTPVPRAPKAVLGIINLRGSVIPVLDLATQLGCRSETSADEPRCIVVARLGEAVGHQAIGLMVDSVAAVVNIDPRDLEPTPDFGMGIRPDYLKGLLRQREGFVLILDLDAACSPRAIAELAAHAQRPAAADQASDMCDA